MLMDAWLMPVMHPSEAARYPGRLCLESKIEAAVPAASYYRFAAQQVCVVIQAIYSPNIFSCPGCITFHRFAGAAEIYIQSLGCFTVLVSVGLGPKLYSGDF